MIKKFMIKRKYEQFIVSLFVVAMLSVFVTGCQTSPDVQPSSPVKIAYATIKSSAIAYDAVMLALGDMDKQGKLKPEQKTQVLKYGNEFWRAYHTAVDALFVYKQSGNGELNLESALITLTEVLSSFLEYSSKITEV